MILGKKSLTYGLIGLFCIPLWAGEKKVQKKDASILEKYWLIKQVNQEQGFPEELIKEIMNYAACTDEEMVKIKNFIHMVNDDLPNPSIRKHIFGLNEQQQEGLLCLIENRRRGASSGRRKVFTQGQYAKMKSVPFVFKKACGEQHALIEIPEHVVLCEERIEGLMSVALWSMIGGTVYGGAGLFYSPQIVAVLDEPVDAYELMMFGACAGGLLRSFYFIGEETDRIQYGARNKHVVRKQILFEQPRLPELDKAFKKKLLVREKQWSRSMLLVE